MRICVYSSSSEALEDSYFQEARRLGELMAEKNYGLVYGAGDIGLMGECARGTYESGGQVIGVIPEALNQKGIVFENCLELHVTKTMHERKAIMEERADAFIALPGGYGTLEELLEVITLKQLKYHQKPIVILNTNDFYGKLLSFFDHIIDMNFAKEACREFYYVASDPLDALSHIEEYEPQDYRDKWFTETTRVRKKPEEL